MERLSDLDFIKGEISEAFKIETVANKPAYLFEITKKAETRRFSTERYIDLVLETYYVRADNNKNYYQKLFIFSEAEHFIKRKIYYYDLEKFGLDFSRIFEDIRVQEKRFRIIYDQIEKRKNKWFDVFKPLAGVLVGALITWLLRPQQKEITLNPVVVKETQVIHDTVYIKKPDTSLVRIVSRKM